MSECDKSLDGDHCPHRSPYQHAIGNHLDEICCHCGATRCVHLGEVTDPLHGPYHPLKSYSRVRELSWAIIIRSQEKA
jgi:hypothetical protein